MKQSKFIHCYYGTGKGKTTAAFGLALRAIGNGYPVLITQFLKSSFTGEIETIQKLSSLCTVKRFNTQSTAVWNMNDDENKILAQESEEGLTTIETLVKETEFKVVILDEILNAIGGGYLSAKKVKEFAIKLPVGTDYVLTGRPLCDEIREIADYITEMGMQKHPFEKGIQARKGIEF